jgi:hypothetical protein
MRRAWAAQLALGVALIALGWASSLADLQPVARHWFDVIWGGWILAADAVVLARSGHSLLRDHPGRMAVLFAVSAPFWWGFEMLNWHVGNWVYAGAEEFGPVARPVLKTIAFSTVLPALAETRDLVRSFVRFPDPPAVPPLARAGERAGAVAVGLGLLGGVLLWLLPGQAFPLMWVAPLLVLDGVAHLRGRPSLLGLVAAGRAGPALVVMASGLLTGILWETWNWGADPHWAYRVPYVGFARLFEMPLLGYLGYLPFALVADAATRTVFGGRGELVDGPLTDLGGDPVQAGPQQPR